jgi:hypothetical protein
VLAENGDNGPEAGLAACFDCQFAELRPTLCFRKDDAIDGFEFLNSKRSTLPAFKQSTRNSAGQINRTQCEDLPFSLLRLVCVEARLWDFRMVCGVHAVRR